MTPPRLLPGIFTETRHLVDGTAAAHGSAHLGVRYRALCSEMCMPAPTGRYTWCHWPVCDSCRTTQTVAAAAALADRRPGSITRLQGHAA